MADFTIENIGDDVIDLRDIIARVEELRALKDDSIAEGEEEELQALESFLSDMAGIGGDEEWEGNYYPVTLIRESYFRTYAEELAEEIGAINRDLSWPYSCIDWEKAANELSWDYSSAECQGITYLFR